MSLIKSPCFAGFAPCLGNAYSQETLWLQAHEGSLIVIEISFFGQEVETRMRIISLTKHLR